MADGVYYFDGEFTVTTVGPSGFPPPATLTHGNTSWAVYGQASYAFSDKFSATGGVRYTDDDKDLAVLGLARAVAFDLGRSC